MLRPPYSPHNPLILLTAAPRREAVPLLWPQYRPAPRRRSHQVVRRECSRRGLSARQKTPTTEKKLSGAGSLFRERSGGRRQGGVEGRRGPHVHRGSGRERERGAYGRRENRLSAARL